MCVLKFKTYYSDQFFNFFCFCLDQAELFFNTILISDLRIKIYWVGLMGLTHFVCSKHAVTPHAHKHVTM